MRWLWKALIPSAVSCVVLAGLPALADSVSVRTDEVCFSVHNEGDPLPSQVYGVRFGEPRPDTPVIILVHGHSITHAFWDVSPDYSVARNLARAGYLVIAYDRLGYGRSPYLRPRGAGFSLTLSSQRAMLHEIVRQVKAGTYTFPIHGSCGGGPMAGLASPRVIVMGHSTGGAIVSGYPGTYHDVAAAVPVGWNNQGFPPEAAAYITTTLAPEYAKGNDYATGFPTEDGCRKTLLYLPEVVPGFLPSFCRRLVAAPAGELMGAARTYAENLAAITRVGSGIPVLLAFEDRDFFFPMDKNAEEFEYWRAHCGCDVEWWTQQDTGHALIAHKSMPTLTSKVVAWLASKGLAAR
jgi:pimeloyl-ACP methyl ester carboxylesterase